MDLNRGAPCSAHSASGFWSRLGAEDRGAGASYYDYLGSTSPNTILYFIFLSPSTHICGLT